MENDILLPEFLVQIISSLEQFKPLTQATLQSFMKLLLAYINFLV